MTGKPKKPKGGARPGAGRPRGLPNSAKVAQLLKVASEGLTPLEFLCAIYRNDEVLMPLRVCEDRTMSRRTAKKTGPATRKLPADRAPSMPKFKALPESLTELTRENEFAAWLDTLFVRAPLMPGQAGPGQALDGAPLEPGAQYVLMASGSLPSVTATPIEDAARLLRGHWPDEFGFALTDERGLHRWIRCRPALPRRGYSFGTVEKQRCRFAAVTSHSRCPRAVHGTGKQLSAPFNSQLSD